MNSHNGQMITPLEGMDLHNGHPRQIDRFEPYKMAHRALRGRYFVTCVLALICAAAGGYLGYRSQHPIYRSESLIQVAYSLPAVMHRNDINEPIEMFDDYLSSQVLLLNSDHVIAAAMETPQWKAAHGRAPNPAPETFAQNLEVDHPAGTQTIRIAYAASSPDEAAAAIHGLVDVYVSTFSDEGNDENARRLALLEFRKADLMQHIQSAIEKVMANPPIITIDHISMFDDRMRDTIKQKSAIEDELARQTAIGMGDSNTSIIRLKDYQNFYTKRVEDYAVEFNKAQLELAISPSNDTKLLMLPQFNTIHENLAAMRKDLQETQDRINSLTIESSMGAKRFTILTKGEVPTEPYKDRRKIMAGLGGFGGAVLPFVLTLTFAGMRRRYRYSEDGQEDLAFLGVLPALPGLLHDEEVAAVAAHCVHHLRVRLQTLVNRDRQQVFMFTSSVAGEGKTSVTSALGYSFAGSATPTLMIDCDIYGAGLTHKLNCEGLPGLVESLQLKKVHNAQHVAENLWLLPVGLADPMFANELSPAHLQAVINDARRRFEVILVDTGPVLGSLEASVAAGSADSVIYVIAQGQAQPLVKHGIELLQTVGANLLGYVFNRASARDYGRSIRGSSISSYRSQLQSKRAAAIEKKTAAIVPADNGAVVRRKVIS